MAASAEHSSSKGWEQEKKLTSIPGICQRFPVYGVLVPAQTCGRCVVIQDFDSRHPSFGSCLALGVKTVHYSKHRVLRALYVDGLCCFAVITKSL